MSRKERVILYLAERKTEFIISGYPGDDCFSSLGDRARFELMAGRYPIKGTVEGITTNGVYTSCRCYGSLGSYTIHFSQDLIHTKEFDWISE